MQFLVFAMACVLLQTLALVPKTARGSFSRVLARAAVTTSTSGAAGTESFRVFFQSDGKAISPWHDIPLQAGDYYNFISEIPK
jgi:inorganic pyrophosphatase